ncbi:hypothetical protein ABB37_04048 [Leptomonas pyrrhocoris]|uniref:F-box domain-containing protein n=1 Tax=Leptomonas pyrrhocoris TaxID=157538 RepID=A0A0N0DWF6_LEPPY|nr:hypothetical protein ABB37_04048 [Leptomonas pyrrhocoris]KPA81762.1 hypothetical protein ABB37_04048 [Leptomonas pyrrhocoris]|eukprot:XP_015660201.1 hypothetical protein ABB37_04048 [Leptomonas pyrrhocoris]
MSTTSSSSHPITLDELFGAPVDSANRSSTAARKASTASQTSPAESIMKKDYAAVLTAPPQTSERHRDVSPAPRSLLVRLLRDNNKTSSNHDLSESGGRATPPLYLGVQRASVEYAGTSTTASREPPHVSRSTALSTTSHATSSGDHISSVTGSTVNRVLGIPPSSSAFSDPASEVAAAFQPDEKNAFTTAALLWRFLHQSQHIATHNSSTPFPKAAYTSTAQESQGYHALRIACLVPSVVPADAAVEANTDAAVAAKLDQAPYLIESTYMRASTITTVLQRQKTQRHAAYSAAHAFFRSPMPLTDTPDVAPPTRLPALLDMPLSLRCAMCQKHDSVCHRCHCRWSKLQESYRAETAIRCYSTLDVNRRGPLGLLTAALGTGAFLEMMSIADGVALTRTRVRVTPASLELLLRSCGRVLSTAIETRLTRAEDATQPYRAMWLKVGHIGCLFGQRDVLRSLWLRCNGGCSYAAQTTANGLHALELLSDPFEPALLTILNKCAALREYLLWARFMQCLAMKAAGDDVETSQLCVELRHAGSWVGAWSEALLAYVKGDSDRCVKLCDELLRGHAALTSAVGGEEGAAAPRGHLARGASVISLASSAVETTNSTPPPPLTSSTSAVTTPTAFSTCSTVDLNRIRSLKELALRPKEWLPHLNAAEEEAATSVVVYGDADRVKEAATEQQQRDPKMRSVRCLPVRRLPFRVVRRILSYCDARTLLHVHGATKIPLLQWITLARIKCLPATQWTHLLTSNVGYEPLMHSLCKFVPPPTPSREEREAQMDSEEVVASVLASRARESKGDAETRAGAAVATACPPFQPLCLSVVDIDDLSHFSVKAVTLAHKTAQREIVAEEPLTVAQRLLQSLFGRATSLINASKYLVLSRVYRLTAQPNEPDIANADVSRWSWEAVQQWEVDVHETIRWCTYAQQHAEAERLL